MEGSRFLASPRMQPAVTRKSTVQTSAAMEIFQLADELSYISGVAAVTFAVTLVVRESSFLKGATICRHWRSRYTRSAALAGFGSRLCAAEGGGAHRGG